MPIMETQHPVLPVGPLRPIPIHLSRPTIPCMMEGRTPLPMPLPLHLPTTFEQQLQPQQKLCEKPQPLQNAPITSQTQELNNNNSNNNNNNNKPTNPMPSSLPKKETTKAPTAVKIWNPALDLNPSNSSHQSENGDKESNKNDQRMEDTTINIDASTKMSDSRTSIKTTLSSNTGHHHIHAESVPVYPELAFIPASLPSLLSSPISSSSSSPAIIADVINTDSQNNNSSSRQLVTSSSPSLLSSKPSPLSSPSTTKKEMHQDACNEKQIPPDNRMEVDFQNQEKDNDRLSPYSPTLTNNSNNNNNNKQPSPLSPDVPFSKDVKQSTTPTLFSPLKPQPHIPPSPHLHPHPHPHHPQLSPFTTPSPIPLPVPFNHPSSLHQTSGHNLLERQLIHNALVLAQSRAVVMNNQHQQPHHHHHQQQLQHLQQQQRQIFQKHQHQQQLHYINQNKNSDVKIIESPNQIHSDPSTAPQSQQVSRHQALQQKQHHHQHQQHSPLLHQQSKLDSQNNLIPDKLSLRSLPPHPAHPLPTHQSPNNERIHLSLHNALALAQSRATLMGRASAAAAVPNTLNYNPQFAAVAPLVSIDTSAPHGYGRKLFPCPQCRYTTDRRNNLKRHMLTMHQTSSKMLECCGILFNTKAALREHAMIFHYHGYTCYFCGRRFCRKALLKRHLSVHNGQKDFVCTVCDYATSHKSNLERHRKVHSRVDEDGKDDDDVTSNDVMERHTHHHRRVGGGYHDDLKSSGSEAMSHYDVTTDDDELSVCSDFDDDDDDTDVEINVHSD